MNCREQFKLMNYRKPLVQGNAYFFTIATHDRSPLLCTVETVSLLGDAFRYAMSEHPFEVDAFVLLPDHLHCVWTLPPADQNLLIRWKSIKKYFAHRYKLQESPEFSTSKKGKGEPTFWQNRFFDCAISDEADTVRYIESIHYDPVKHGHVDTPKDWQYSSFQRYVRNGWYEAEWGSGETLEFGVTLPDDL
jgi:putative transposase